MMMSSKTAQEEFKSYSSAVKAGQCQEQSTITSAYIVSAVTKVVEQVVGSCGRGRTPAVRSVTGDQHVYRYGPGLIIRIKAYAEGKG